MSQCIIISGMHRSGTSLITSFLSKSGLNIGSNLIPPYKDNPTGYFEDKSFVEYHKFLLKKHNIDLFLPSSIQLDISDIEIAKKIIDEKIENSLWGWKDPRTILFLELWSSIIKDAFYIFIFRNPSMVIDSLIRRETDPSIIEKPSIAARSWILYNSKLLQFINRHNRKVALYNIDDIIKHPENFLNSINNQFDLNLKIIDFNNIFKKNLYSNHALSTKSKVISLLYWKRMYFIYRQLEDKKICI